MDKPELDRHWHLCLMAATDYACGDPWSIADQERHLGIAFYGRESAAGYPWGQDRPRKLRRNAVKSVPASRRTQNATDAINGDLVAA
jgi:hypothetical protein